MGILEIRGRINSTSPVGDSTRTNTPYQFILPEAFMVLIRVSTSWVTQPNSKQDLFKWFDPYVNHFYKTVGVVDIPLSGQANYYWNSQAEDRMPESNFWVMVFKRQE